MSIKRLSPLIALVAIISSLALAPSASACTGADLTYSAANADAMRDAVICLTNVERTARGLPALEAESRLGKAATAHTRDMATKQYFSHTGLNGSSVADRIIATGYPFRAAGENIAAGYKTARSVMLGWMQSKGHCLNILRPSFTEIGVGLAKSDDQYGLYWTQNFGSRTAVSSNNKASDGCPFNKLSEATSQEGQNGPTCTSAATDAPGKIRLTSARRSSKTRVRVGGKLTADGCCPKVRFTVKRGKRSVTTTKKICTKKFVLSLKSPRGKGKARVSATIRASKSKATRTAR